MKVVAKGKVKSDATRARILGAALELFHDRGFEATTMREIATAAGVATGGAYYYFDSKDAIVLAFYDQAQKDMVPRLEEVLAGGPDLAQRLRGILHVKLEYFGPSRGFLNALAAHTDPRHALSPFSAQTLAIRENDMGYFARQLLEKAAVFGCRTICERICLVFSGCTRWASFCSGFTIHRRSRKRLAR